MDAKLITEIKEAFNYCLYKSYKGIDSPTKLRNLLEKGFVLLHTGRLEEKQSQIIEWLKAIPSDFKFSEENGFSILACRNGMVSEWIEFNEDITELLIMGMRLNLIDYLLPPEMWAPLPKGLPYYVIKI